LRTLVISDLHLGNRAQRDVLRRPEPLSLLLAALRDVDRLVLLGDVAELVTRTPARSMAAAEPVLRAIGAAMRGREILHIPGNHDMPLVRGWIRAQGRSLAVDGEVPLWASRAVARLAGWLAPAHVRISYPGAWLDQRTYATHGHYLDHHLIPQSPIGLPRGRLAQPLGEVSAADYERGRIRSHHGRDATLARPLTAAADGLADLLRASVLSRMPKLLMNARMGPVGAAAVDLQMRRAALPAIDAVIARLGVDADTVLFGHVHRLGPLGDDPPEQWRRLGPSLFNSGAWLYDPLLVQRARPPHPYWPGGAILLESGRGPRVVGLLDELPRELLAPPGRLIPHG
jgi:predicted phosphodiesterase